MGGIWGMVIHLLWVPEGWELLEEGNGVIYFRKRST
jgi:hypothetical protein